MIRRRRASDREWEELRRADRQIQALLGAVLIIGGGFFLWLGWMICTWIDHVGVMPK